MRTHTLLIGLAVLLCGCGGVRKALTPPAARDHAPHAAAGAPKPKPGRDWTFSPAGANAALTYGSAGSAPQLMMACAQKSGAVVIGAPATAEIATPTLTLVSGTVRTSVAAAVQPWPADPSLSVLSARFSTLDPLVLAFARNRAIGLAGKGDKADKVDALVEQPGGSAISQFLSFCG